MKIHIVDVETTGLDPEKDRIVELAAVMVSDMIDGRWIAYDERQSFVDPGIPIPPEASGVHHIIDEDVKGAPQLFEAIEDVFGLDWQDGVDLIAGHNCRFDRDFLTPLRNKSWIDTWRCAMHVWPDAPGFGNQTLRYWLGIVLPRDGAHRALADARVTAEILIRLLAERSIDELRRLSTKAVVLKKVGFGKHFGLLWTEVPKSYLEWARDQDFEPDVRHTIKFELARRRGDLQLADPAPAGRPAVPDDFDSF
jgi:exodeoxyribonuclease X